MKISGQKKSIIFSLIIFTIVFSFLLYTAKFIENRHIFRQKILYLEQLTEITTQVSAKLKSNINQLEGLVTYIESYPESDPKDLDIYTKHLLTDYEDSILNISILKDTTIVYKYPPMHDDLVLGTDLAKIPDQKDGILKIKNTLKTGFIGPINLVEGGQAFISRVPIVVHDQYWGQLTILLDVEYFYNYLSSITSQTDLDITIYSSNNITDTPIYGMPLDSDIDSVQVADTLFDDTWTIIAYPKDHWKNATMLKDLLLLLAISISILVSVFMYFILKTKYALAIAYSTDWLTGLYSRNNIDVYFKKSNFSINQNSTFYLYIIDINNFKKINDNYGHDVGDKVLIHFSNRLKDVSINQSTAFRLSGDEFMLVVQIPVNKNNAFMLHEELNNATHYKYIYKELSLNISASIGCATYPAQGKTVDELMLFADHKMYEDKEIYHQQNIDEKNGDQYV